MKTLTADKIIEGNNLIQGFIGTSESIKDVNDFIYAWRYEKDGSIINYTELNFDISMDALMPAIVKIQSIKGSTVIIHNNSCEIMLFGTTIGYGMHINMSTSVWLAVVEFIKLYKLNKT